MLQDDDIENIGFEKTGSTTVLTYRIYRCIERINSLVLFYSHHSHSTTVSSDVLQVQVFRRGITVKCFPISCFFVFLLLFGFNRCRVVFSKFLVVSRLT